MKGFVFFLFYCIILIESRRIRNARTGKKFDLKSVGLLGVPFGGGQNQTGTVKDGLEASPDIMRPKLMRALEKLDINVKDFGNAVATNVDKSLNCSNMNNFPQVMASNQKVSDIASEIFKQGLISLAIGGDHTMHVGTLHALLGAVGEDNVAVLYLDGHADINLASTSDSGNMHGMVHAIQAKELEVGWNNCTVWPLPRRRISLRSIGFIGLRSVDPPEKEIMDEFNMVSYNMNDVVSLGIAEVLRQVMARIDPYGSKVIHLSIDTDSLDPSVTPSTTTPVLGGLLLRELVYIVSQLCRTGRVAAIDWAELNSLTGTHEQQFLTQNAALTGLLACFGGGPQ